MQLCKCCSGRGSSLTAAVALLLTACAGLLLAYPARDAVTALIRAGIRDYSVLDSPSAGGWPGWLDSRDPSAGQVTSRYYVFNITNVEAILKGAKPDEVVKLCTSQPDRCLGWFDTIEKLSQTNTIARLQAARAFSSAPGARRNHFLGASSRKSS